MTTEQMETLRRAVWTFGPAQQEIKTVEELAELQQAMCKAVGLSNDQWAGTDDFADALDHVFEEIADVEIMLAQIRIIFQDADKEIATWKDRKINRLKTRLPGGRSRHYAKDQKPGNNGNGEVE